MKPKTLILMVVAIGCALLAALVVTRLSGKGPGGDEVVVWVAKAANPKDLNVPFAVDTATGANPEQYFEQKGFPKDLAPLGAITDYEQLKNKFVREPMHKGDVCTTKTIGDSKSLAQSLAKGNVGMSIQVTQFSSVAGFVYPGARINIIGTIQEQGDSQRQSKTILEDVKVLAVNQSDTVATDRKSVMPTVITVEVSKKDSEMLARYISGGTVVLAMRSLKDDDKKSGTEPATTAAGKAKPDVPKVEVLVAKKDIEGQTPINEENFKEFFESRKFPKDIVPAEAIRTQADLLKHAKVERFLAKDSVVVAGHFKAGKQVATGPKPKVKPKAPEKEYLEQSFWNGAVETKVLWERVKGGDWKRSTRSTKPEPQIPELDPVGPGSEGKS